MKITRLTNTTSFRVKLAIAIALVAFVIIARVAPHPANFAPIAAAALFAGALLPRRWALTVPLAAMVSSDLLIGLHPLVLYTWGSYMLIAFASSQWLRSATPLNLGASSIAASVLFYVVTNFGVWMQGLMYPMNVGGLVHCYVNALPFFRGTLTGDLFYTGVLFGAYATVTSLAKRLRSMGVVKHSM